MAEVFGLREAGEMRPDELLMCAAHLQRRREAEDQKWDRRFFSIWVAIGRFFVGAYEDLDAERLFPALFETAEATEDDPDLIERKLIAWCLSVGGTIKQPDDGQKEQRR